MKLSDRITGLTGGGSDGWDVFYKARAMKAADHDIVELTIGEHDRRTDPSILNAMHQSALGGHTGYATLPGTDALRDEVARRITERTGVATERGNILITPGGQSALFAAHAATCDAGDSALFIDPYYATYPGTLRGVGAKAVAITARVETGFQLSRDDLNVAPDAAKSLLINSPNNPTGAVYTSGTMRNIANFTRDRDIWLISDEVYETMIWQGQHFSPRALPGMKDRTIVVGSMSKSHAMTGSRIGWLAGPENVVDHLATLATHTTYGVAGFVQDAALFALNQGLPLEHKIAEPFRHRHAATLDQLAKRGLPTVPSSATMYLMVDIRRTGLSGEDFAYRLLADRHIAVMPGESFGQAAAGHIRVALTVPEDVLASSIEDLAELYEVLISEAA
ncbi:MAG: aminotransferase class I/II-fold pyridoxal phosphate-dependent enzyme [Boseongicola sp.]|nr:MAG: aminotransferase class I/II-fold pyridoxal phosphate-dependent enzyme [Boseongicola sp.]